MYRHSRCHDDGKMPAAGRVRMVRLLYLSRCDRHRWVMRRAHPEDLGGAATTDSDGFRILSPGSYLILLRD